MRKRVGYPRGRGLSVFNLRRSTDGEADEEQENVQSPVKRRHYCAELVRSSSVEGQEFFVKMTNLSAHAEEVVALENLVATLYQFLSGEAGMNYVPIIDQGAYVAVASRFHENLQPFWSQLDPYSEEAEALILMPLRHRDQARSFVSYSDPSPAMQQRKAVLNQLFSPGFAKLLVTSWLLEENDFHLGQFARLCGEGANAVFLRYDFDHAMIVFQQINDMLLEDYARLVDSEVFAITPENIQSFPFLPKLPMNWITRHIPELERYAAYCKTNGSEQERQMVLTFEQTIQDVFNKVANMPLSLWHNEILKDQNANPFVARDMLVYLYETKIKPLRLLKGVVVDDAVFLQNLRDDAMRVAGPQGSFGL